MIKPGISMLLFFVCYLMLRDTMFWRESSDEIRVSTAFAFVVFYVLCLYGMGVL